MKVFALVALAAVALASPQVSQITDGQIQAPTAPVVTQITDGQVQAPPNVTVPPFTGHAVSSAVTYFSVAIGAATAGLAILL